MNEDGDELTFDLLFEPFRLLEHQRRRLAIHGVGRVRVSEQLRQEHLKDIDQVEQGAPGLVDHIETYGARHLVDVGVEDGRREADRR